MLDLAKPAGALQVPTRSNLEILQGISLRQQKETLARAGIINQGRDIQQKTFYLPFKN